MPPRPPRSSVVVDSLLEAGGFEPPLPPAKESAFLAGTGTPERRKDDLGRLDRPVTGTGSEANYHRRHAPALRVDEQIRG